MLFTAPNFYAERFVRISANDNGRDQTSLAEIFLSLVADDLFSETPETWLDTIADCAAKIAAGLNVLTNAYFDPKNTKHAPKRQGVTIENVRLKTGLDNKHSAFLLWLLAKSGVAGFDATSDLLAHTGGGAGTVPSAKQLIASCLAGQFFDKEFSFHIQAAIGDAQRRVLAGSPNKKQNIWFFGDETLNNVCTTLNNAIATVASVATAKCSIHGNYDVDYYYGDLETAAALLIFRKGLRRCNANLKVLSECSDAIRKICAISNVRAVFDGMSASAVEAIAGRPFAPGAITELADLMSMLGTEKMQLWVTTSGRQYAGKAYPLSVRNHQGTTVLAPEFVVSSKPLVHVGTFGRDAGTLGRVFLENSKLNGSVGGAALQECAQLAGLLNNILTQYAFNINAYTNYSKKLVPQAKLGLEASCPVAALIDIIAEQGDPDFMTIEEDSVVKYRVRGCWTALARVAGDSRFLTAAGVGLVQSAAMGALLIAIDKGLPDVEDPKSTSISPVLDDPSAHRAVDAEWIEGVMAKSSDPDAEHFGIELSQLKSRTATIYFPGYLVDHSTASSFADLSGTGGYALDVDVQDIWRIFRVPSMRFVTVTDLQQADRIERMADLTTTLFPNSLSSVESVDDEVIAYLKGLTERARGLLGMYAVIKLEENGVSFETIRHSATYLAQLNSAVSLTALSCLITVIGSVNEQLAATMNRFVDLGTQYARKQGLNIFDIGHLPTETFALMEANDVGI